MKYTFFSLFIVSSMMNALETREDIFLACGNSLLKNSRYTDALEQYHHAAACNPSSIKAHFGIGITYGKMKEYALATKIFQQIIAREPTHIKALMHLGLLALQKKQYDDAFDYFSRIIAVAPSCMEAHFYCGIITKQTYRLSESLAHFQTAHTYDPDNIATITNITDLLNMLQRDQEALDLCDKTLKKHPANIRILNNTALILMNLRRPDLACAYCDAVLALDPDCNAAHANRSIASLTCGDFARGFEEYAWRTTCINTYKTDDFDQPVWDGSQSLQNKTVFLYPEQGMGDMLQFIRYAQVLKQQGARAIIVAVQKPLIPLISRCAYVDQVITIHDTPPPFDYHASVMSLPQACNTTLETIPHDIPYLFADQERMHYWQKKLKQDTHFKIGICWHGSSTYTDPSLCAAVAKKSVPLALFEQLSTLPHVTLYSLQQHSGLEQLDTCPFALHTFDEKFDRDYGRFMDTAAVMQQLDLILTVDTATAHLAGGLGIPTWIMLPYASDWRWLLDRDDSPWYPTTRLFRQDEPGNWHTVMNSIVHAVKHLIYTKKGTV